MTIRWDALLLRELARELSARLSGHRLRAIRLAGSTRTMTLLLRDETLVWDLHPARGGLRFFSATRPGPGDLSLPCRVRTVRAPTDERILVLDLLPLRKRGRWQLIVELLGNQWNALVMEKPGDRIRHVLVRRHKSRVLRVGSPYVPPPPSSRAGAEAPLSLSRWREIVEPIPPPQRAKELVARVAWTSPINAASFVDPDVTSGHALWRSLAFPEEGARPVLLDLDRGAQPYPWPLPGVSSRPAGSLLEALQEVAATPAGDDPGPGADFLPPEVLSALETTTDEALRRCTRLQAELDRTEEPDVLRARGDLLLSRLSDVPPGSEGVTLEDFDGTTLTLPLDPRLSGAENAAAYYDEAARTTRARARLPGLVSQARSDAQRLQELLARARAGEADVSEIRAVIPAVPPPTRGQAAAPPSLPYLRYVSSGGLEIRVGRGARFNDELTFRHSSPGDVWLHARHAAGAHVILRWAGPGNPPGRDLEEAAVLAARNSKARTAGSVPVDWTFRKYVRKPRGAPPGTVAPQRVRTLFVDPDPGIEERLSRR